MHKNIIENKIPNIKKEIAKKIDVIPLAAIITQTFILRQRIVD